VKTSLAAVSVGAVLLVGGLVLASPWLLLALAGGGLASYGALRQADK